MNGKKAKALRRIAQQQTVGFEEREYLSTGKIFKRVVDAKCTRGVQLYLKKEMKRGALSLRKGAA